MSRGVEDGCKVQRGLFGKLRAAIKPPEPHRGKGQAACDELHAASCLGTVVSGEWQ